MNDNEPKDIKSQSITGIVVPVALGIIGGKAIGLDKVLNQVTTMTQNFAKNVDLLRSIKPYFSHSEQFTISKIQDVFDVLNKVGRIKGQQYEAEIYSLDTEMSVSEKKQKIIQEFYNYLDGDKKQIIDKAMEVKDQIFTTKNKVSGLMTLDEVGVDNRMDVLFEFMKCFKPILSEEHNKKIDKFEKAVQILRSDE